MNNIRIRFRERDTARACQFLGDEPAMVKVVLNDDGGGGSGEMTPTDSTWQYTTTTTTKFHDHPLQKTIEALT